MPELPEVETVRRGLADKFVGRLIERVEVGRERTVRRTSREELIGRLTGVRAVDARRRGKYLLCSLDSGDELMIHLRMSGQVLIVHPDEPRPDHCHVVLTLGPRSGPMEDAEDRAELRFVDPRTFGEVIAYDPLRVPPVLPELERLGIDPIAEGLDARDLERMLGRTRRVVKAVLLDQHAVAGIGNIYADEILHRARINPLRAAASLDRTEVASLTSAIVEVLGTAVESGGSTLRDARYVDTSGVGGTYQQHHRVYARAGEPCTTCGRAEVVTARVCGRSTCWCPVCQPVLAPSAAKRRPGGGVVS